MHNLDWSDLRFVLAVAEQGSAAAAARALGVNHATVIRHVRALEKTQGLRIFDHLASGYRLTSEGEIFLDAARAIGATVTELERKIVGGQDELAGDVCVTTTDGLVPLLIDATADLRRRYPDLTLELSITNHHLKLETLDADIALRPTPDPPPTLSGRRVGELAFGIYAAAVLADDDGRFAAVDDAPWLGLSAPLSSSVPGRWLGETIPPQRFGVRCNSFISCLELAEQGLGYTLLPCYLGDRSPTLRRVLAAPLPFRNTLWLLSHRDLLRSRRVQTCVDFFYRRLRLLRPALRGATAEPQSG